MAHHREEFGPEEPDMALYVGYPVPPDSFRRKLWRDATGQTGWEPLKGLLPAPPRRGAVTRRAARSIIAVQLGLAAVSAALGYPLVYWLLWFLPYLTAWRVINRL